MPEVSLTVPAQNLFIKGKVTDADTIMIFLRSRNKWDTVISDIGDKEAAWKNAINIYEIKWLQVLNADSVNDLSVTYNVEAYPTKLGIDKDGKLVQISTGESDYSIKN